MIVRSWCTHCGLFFSILGCTWLSLAHFSRWWSLCHTNSLDCCRNVESNVIPVNLQQRKWRLYVLIRCLRRPDAVVLSQHQAILRQQTGTWWDLTVISQQQQLNDSEMLRCFDLITFLAVESVADKHIYRWMCSFLWTGKKLGDKPSNNKATKCVLMHVLSNSRLSVHY